MEWSARGRSVAAGYPLGPDRLIDGQVLTAQPSRRDDRALVDFFARELPD